MQQLPQSATHRQICPYFGQVSLRCCARLTPSYLVNTVFPYFLHYWSVDWYLSKDYMFKRMTWCSLCLELAQQHRNKKPSANCNHPDGIIVCQVSKLQLIMALLISQAECMAAACAA